MEYTTEYNSRNSKYNVGSISKTKESMGGYYFIVLGRLKSNSRRYVIMFLDENKCIKDVDCSDLKRGAISNPYHKSVFGVGFVGEGEYYCKRGRKQTKVYDCWHSMIRRCYSEYSLKINKTYKNVKVCREWHNFQVFAKWYDDNFPIEVVGVDFQLDKDLLCGNEKIYSPRTCLFIPRKINALLAKCNKEFNGKMNHKKDEWGGIKIRVTDFETGEYKYLGYVKTKEEAVIEYNKFKIVEIEKAKEYMRSFGIYSEETISKIGGFLYE